MSTKAQVISSDFMLASVIFILIVSIIYLYWNNLSHKINEERRITGMIDAAFLASNSLLSDGMPEYWNETNVVDIGLQNDHRINSTKLQMIDMMGYDKVKEMLGLNYYEFYFRIYDKSNQTIYDFGRLSDSFEIVKVKRYSIMDGNIVYIDFMVWS
ncbi:MAG: hypothetical protein QXF88_01500 [Candidatus Aenigmatarchaeota archaeon]